MNNVHIKEDFTSDKFFYIYSRRERMASTILEDVSNALNSWMQRITNLESRIDQTVDYREAVINSLEGQVLDGLITDLDSRELQFILDSWINLYISILHYNVGVASVDRDIFTYLLRLLAANQISEDFFIEVALEVCRGTVNSL